MIIIRNCAHLEEGGVICIKGSSSVRDGFLNMGLTFESSNLGVPSCPDQEGRRGSAEVVPENLGVPLQGDRDAGELGGAHQGCQYRFDLQFLMWDFS